MISVATAEEIIHAHWPDFGHEYLGLAEVSPMNLETSVRADRSYPPGNRVLMDGIAVGWSLYQHGQRQYPIATLLAAGDCPPILTPEEGCLEVMTGAYLPQGYDLVIPYEDLKIDQHQAFIQQERPRSQYEHIHRFGADCHGGDELLPPHTNLNGPVWGVLASLGKSTVKVRRSPRIQIISTGNELIEVHQIPQFYQLRRSNLYALKTSLLKRGYQHINLAHLPDHPDSIRSHFHQATQDFDVLLYSGGVSKGKLDYLPQLWQELGVTNYIHGVAQRPGKPLWFGVDQSHQTAIIGLPGNPVSSMVCLHRYFLPPNPSFAQLAADIHFTKPLTYFPVVKITALKNAVTSAQPLPFQNSSEFIILAQSDGFIELPPEPNHFKAGDCFPFYPW